MPSAGQISFVFDQTRMRWMTSLTSGRFQPPLSLTEGNTVDFVFRLSNNGVLFTPPLTPVWIFGIKDANTPSGDFLIQVNSATSASGVFTFVVELASAELQAWLATATSQSYAAIQITDSANDIATAPLLCQIAPNQNDTGTTPTSANGTLNVTAGKTVTFPQSLTFPSALGTNGFQLSTDGAGTLTWAASGALTDGDKGDITVSNSGATFTIDNDVVGLAQLAHMPTARVIGRTTSGNGSPELLTISGTGSVAMTNTPTLVTPVLGAATATSINGITLTGGATAGTIDVSDTGGSIETSSNGGSIATSTSGGNIYTYDSGGSIDTSQVGGGINTSLGGGSITTNGNGSIGLGTAANRITLVGTTASNGKTATFPNVTGTVAVAATSATATQALFATATAGAPEYRAIATADIATALTTPGAIGGTTASTGAFTTLTSSSTTDSTTTATGAIQTLGGLGVAKSIFAGGIINIPTTTSTVGQIKQNGTRLLHSYGTQNLFLGGSAGNFTLTGSANVGIGRATFGALTNGARNMAFGDGTMYQITSGADNCAIGAAALNGVTSGSSNVGLGSSALTSTTAGGNTGIGYLAGQHNTTGVNNVFIGYNSGGAVGSVDLTRCITLGTTAAITANSLSYCTVIGSDATSSTSNSVTLGRAADTVILPGGLVTVPIAQTATTAAVSVAVTTTALTTTGVAQAITLANGTNGQIKIITHIANGGTGTAVLTPATSAADYNTITFSSVGDTATLQYHTTGGWYILSLRGAVAA